MFQQIQNGTWPPSLKRNQNIIISPQRIDHFDEIWHGDASQPSGPRQQIKLYDFQNPRWRPAAILKIQKKSQYLKNSCADFSRFWCANA